MAPYKIITIEDQVNALDQETAERVTRLVFECSASLDLAILAVQDANKDEGTGRQGDKETR
jgi:hypothetical protein